MSRVVVVPSTLALLPAYASLEDPVAEVRAAVDGAVAWLLEDGPAAVLGGSPSARRIGASLLGEGADEAGPGLLVVANGSARRTEKAPGHLDVRAADFDARLGDALARGDLDALAATDLALAEELLAGADARTLAGLSGRIGRVEQAQVDLDADPHGVQYWVVRWTCAS